MNSLPQEKKLRARRLRTVKSYATDLSLQEMKAISDVVPPPFGTPRGFRKVLKKLTKRAYRFLKRHAS